MKEIIFKVCSKEQVWHPNTHLSVNLKTMLRSDRCVKEGKNYLGVLRRDVEIDDFLYDDHFTFVESEPHAAEKRNVHVFRGEYITITRKNDGTLRPNFRPMPKIGEKISVECFTFEVYRELRQALKGLIGEK